jgi:hypothetical protein
MKKYLVATMLLASGAVLSEPSGHAIPLWDNNREFSQNVGPIGPSDEFRFAVRSATGTGYNNSIIQVEVSGLPEGNAEDNIVIGYYEDDQFVQEYAYRFSDIVDGSFAFVFVYDGVSKQIFINSNSSVGTEDLIVTGTLLEEDSVPRLNSLGQSRDIILGKLHPDMPVTLWIDDWLPTYEDSVGVYNFELNNFPYDDNLGTCSVEFRFVQDGMPQTSCMDSDIVNEELSFSFKNELLEDMYIQLNPHITSGNWDDNDGVQLSVELVDIVDEISLEPGNVYVNNFGSVGDSSVDYKYLLDPSQDVDIRVELSGLSSSEYLGVRVDVAEGAGIIEEYTGSDVNNGVIKTSFDAVSPSELSVSVSDNHNGGIGQHVRSLISVDEHCTTLIDLDLNYNHRYDTSCESNQHANRYASYFMFYVPEVADFNVGVWSNAHADLDNVVYLYKGYLRDGELIASDDDSSNRTPLGAQITQIELWPGWYTVESTTAVGRKNGRPIVRVAKQ